MRYECHLLNEYDTHFYDVNDILDYSHINGNYDVSIHESNKL